MADSAPESLHDLTRTYPRSPSVRLEGIAHLPRMLDKARAKVAGCLGEYLYPCPMDERVLAFLELSAQEIADTAATNDDTQVAIWIASHGATRTDEEKATFSADLLSLGPENDESWRHFRTWRDEIAPGRDDVTSFAALIDLDEGRTP